MHGPGAREPGQCIKGSRAGPTAHVIPKTKDPAPGTYEEVKAEEATQKAGALKWMFAKERRVSHFEK